MSQDVTTPLPLRANPEAVWKDEMNFCELPVALLTDRMPKNLRQLEFEITDPSGQRPQRLTIIPPSNETIRALVKAACPWITLPADPNADARPRRNRKPVHHAADENRPPDKKAPELLDSLKGLPTATDDDVLLAMVQLSRRDGFSNRKVQFSLYEIINMLGWDGNGRSYTRAMVSILRWKAVLLTYQDSWRDNKQRQWVTRTFNILDDVTIYGGGGRRERNGSQGSLPLSSFTWNEVVFKSFQDGYLKNLDFGTYQSLQSRIARRMYRFLDKCFGRLREGGVAAFDLREFASGHLGLVGDYAPWKLKQVLAPAIRELEARHIIRPLSDTERYPQVGHGQWQILFHPADPALKAVNTPPAPPTDHARRVAELTRRGVTAAVAEVLVRDHSERIERHIDIFDWMAAQTGSELKNPGGWLRAAIEADYQPPANYRPKTERERAARASEERQRAKTEAKRRERADQERYCAERAHAQRFLAELEADPDQRKAFEAQAVANADPTLQEAIRCNGPMARIALQTALMSEALRVRPLNAVAAGETV